MRSRGKEMAISRNNTERLASTRGERMSQNSTEKNPVNKDSLAALKLRLEELSRNYEISLDLTQKATDGDALMDEILDEFIRRLSEIPKTNIAEVAEEPTWSFEKEKVKSLVMFATQAMMLKENADLHDTVIEKNTRLRALIQRQRKSNTYLKRLNSHYLNILNFVTHEVKNPLITILGFSELLADKTMGELNAEQVDTAQLIVRASKNLIGMINNYLDLSRFENGELNIKFQPLNLQQEVIIPVAAEFCGQLAKKEMTIESTSAAGEPEIILYGSAELLPERGAESIRKCD